MFFYRNKKNARQSVFAAPAADVLSKKPKSQSRKINWKAWFFGIFLILALAGLVYIFVFSPIFKIKSIKINGSNLIAEEQIRARVINVLQDKFFKIIPRDTFFALADNKIKDDLLAAYSEIENVKFEKTQADQLSVTVAERKTAAVLCQAKIVATSSPTPSIAADVSSSTPEIKETLPESEQCFFIDEDGIVYREAPEISGTILPNFYVFNPELPRLREQAVGSNEIKFAAQIKKELRGVGIDLVGFVQDGGVGAGLKAFSGEGWLIYFDSSRPALTQARILEALLRNEIKDKRATLKYIDLRVENRVYYK
ncbi:FtsQ-type POTRA domain-containing protein [Patescibacteria group bacterium]|nr:FtsQ-type POTRA domain-containing protein [Patescibacteria group bacterium]